MTRQEKIKAFERRGYKVIITYRPSSGRPLHRVWIQLPGTSYCRQFNSVNAAYNHRPWNFYVTY